MLKKIILSTIAVLVLIQLISIDKSVPKTDKRIALNAPEKVMNILKKSCYDCHSYETKWPWYSDIAPVSFFVSSHVKKGRKAINFSIYDEIGAKRKIKRLERAVITVNNERMALPSYVSAHEEAKLNKEEKKILIEWLKEEVTSLNKALEPQG